MREVYAAAAPIIPTGKPYGELVPFVGEAVLRCREEVDLVLNNITPEGRHGFGDGEMLVLLHTGTGGGVLQHSLHLFSPPGTGRSTRESSGLRR